MDSILVVISFVIAFALALFSYRKGLADGIRIKEGKPVEKPKRPKKEQATNIKEGIERDIANILNYRNRRMRNDED